MSRYIRATIERKSGKPFEIEGERNVLDFAIMPGVLVVREVLEKVGDQYKVQTRAIIALDELLMLTVRDVEHA